MSFLALGDSYTIGEGVADTDRWPSQLAARLRAAGQPIDDPRIIARTGWTTVELLAAVAGEQVEGPFDLVTLLAGVNDQYGGQGVERFRGRFDRLLRIARGLAKLPARLIVLSIPDWSVTPFAADRDRRAIAREIDQFNDVCRTTTVEAGARYLDITPLSRQAGNDRALLVSDGLHPSAAMYSMWAEQAVPMSRAALGAS
jgi:lysophospholipase L1-like esterase